MSCNTKKRKEKAAAEVGRNTNAEGFGIDELS
jgi:hypothetical protein